MEIFDCYKKMDFWPVKAKGATLWDKDGNEYLDFYGGHAVISIGHGHPHFLEALQSQLELMAYYSNAIINPLQDKIANKLGELCGYPDYKLFLCNSGAEAVENAVKLASFHNGRKNVIAFSGAFHGRTAMALALSDSDAVTPSCNRLPNVSKLPLNDISTFAKALNAETAAVIIEGIQGVGGIICPKPEFLHEVAKLCRANGTLLVLDEIQSGYGRSGAFFAHQLSGVKADLITVAKGMGNGFPIGGVLISPKLVPKPEMLGTTFGGNHLACAAAIAVLEVIEREKLLSNAKTVGEYLKTALRKLPGILELRGHGLMLGIETTKDAEKLQSLLLAEHRSVVGISKKKNSLRLLPPLTISTREVDQFVGALTRLL